MVQRRLSPSWLAPPAGSKRASLPAEDHRLILRSCQGNDLDLEATDPGLAVIGVLGVIDPRDAEQVVPKAARVSEISDRKSVV